MEEEKEFKVVKENHIDFIRTDIKKCQKRNHVQQVAYSTYHDCLTQICFSCEVIRTNIKL